MGLIHPLSYARVYEYDASIVLKCKRGLLVVNMQMALIARIQHPYIVEFKEAWVEKVRAIEASNSCLISPHIDPENMNLICHFFY